MINLSNLNFCPFKSCFLCVAFDSNFKDASLPHYVQETHLTRIYREIWLLTLNRQAIFQFSVRKNFFKSQSSSIYKKILIEK